MKSLADYICEAESGTANARQIYAELKNAGYKKLGHGVDATVWAKDDQSVLKIIMPQYTLSRDNATQTFMKFYNFAQQHQDLRCLPRFKKIQGEHFSQFSLNGKNYLQISMEKLRPLRKGSAEEHLVWHLSDYARDNISWEQVAQELREPENFTDLKPSEQRRYQAILSDPSLQLEYKMLFTVMKLLYVTGSINNMGWDLHTENAMQRADGTVVIVDPWLSLV